LRISSAVRTSVSFFPLIFLFTFFLLLFFFLFLLFFFLFFSFTFFRWSGPFLFFGVFFNFEIEKKRVVFSRGN
jgi:hypothetical protein